MIRESSFNMTSGGDEDIEGGLRKFLDTRRGGSEKIVVLGGGAPKIFILQNQHNIIIQIGWFSTQQFNDLAVQLSYIMWLTDITNVVSVIITLSAVLILHLHLACILLLVYSLQPLSA